MKYLLTLSIIVSYVHCVAQKYVPFPIGKGYWQYNGYYDELGAHSRSTLFLFSTTDTVFVNGKAYYKIKKNGSDYFAVREENKRVYAYKAGYPEFTLFDFNMGVGDQMPLVFAGRYFTITTMGEEFEQMYIPIVGIDSINIGNVFRKRYLFGPDAYVVEGVGGSFGLLLYLANYQEKRFYFTCFNDGYAFIHPGSDRCEYPWPTNIAEPAIIGPRIYPNPFINLIHIVGQDKGTMHLYNTIGQLVLTKNVQETECTIEVEALPCGLYTICFLNSEGKIVHRQQLIKE